MLYHFSQIKWHFSCDKFNALGHFKQQVCDMWQLAKNSNRNDIQTLNRLYITVDCIIYHLVPYTSVNILNKAFVTCDNHLNFKLNGGSVTCGVQFDRNGTVIYKLFWIMVVGRKLHEILNILCWWKLNRIR